MLTPFDQYAAMCFPALAVVVAACMAVLLITATIRGVLWIWRNCGND